MFFDDLVEIIFINIGIPGALWINHDHGTFIAAIHASCRVDADFVLEFGNAERFHPALHVIAGFLRAVVVAAGFTGFALVGAEKNMFIEKTHGRYRMDGEMRNYTLRNYNFLARHR
jgi:hypothetical protein